MAMHDCDLMIAVGARFDDRITGRLDAFSPGSKKIHIDIDPSSINKNVKVDLGDHRRLRPCAARHDRCLSRPQGRSPTDSRARPVVGADRQLARRANRWPSRQLERGDQAAICGPAALRADAGAQDLHHDRSRPASDVGGAALSFRGAEPLDDLGRPRHHGLRPAGGDRRAARPSRRARHRHRRRSLDPDEHPGDVDRRRSIDLPVKIFILNNEYMGMVRQWQELLHGGRYSQSYSEALPDFVKLAEAYGAMGIRCSRSGRSRRRHHRDDRYAANR